MREFGLFTKTEVENNLPEVGWILTVAALETVTVLPKRFVAGPGAIIANGAGAKSAISKTRDRKITGGLEMYLGIAIPIFF